MLRKQLDLEDDDDFDDGAVVDSVSAAQGAGRETAGASQSGAAATGGAQREGRCLAW